MVRLAKPSRHSGAKTDQQDLSHLNPRDTQLSEAARLLLAARCQIDHRDTNGGPCIQQIASYHNRLDLSAVLASVARRPQEISQLRLPVANSKGHLPQ
jgi:hypothetical protein